jgi:hypothetical protein
MGEGVLMLTVDSLKIAVYLREKRDSPQIHTPKKKSTPAPLQKKETTA